MKPVLWIGSSLEVLRAWPEDARRRAGRQLSKVQVGLAPSDWKPLPSVGPGVCEIRVHASTEHRLLYIATFEEAIYVLHCFEKRTRSTRQMDLELARIRLAAVIRARTQAKRG